MRKLAGVFAFLVVVSLLTGLYGCSKSVVSPTPVESQAPTAVPTQAPTSTPSATPVKTATPAPTGPAATATPVPAATPKPTATPTPTPTPVPTSTAPVIAKQTWKLTHGYQPDSIQGKSAQMFADMVTEASGGQIKVQIFPNATLFPANRDPEAVGTGAAQVSFTPGMVMTPQGPFFNVLNMDGLWENYDHVWKVIHSDAWTKSVTDALAKVSVKYLGTAPDQMGAWYVVDRLIKVPQDFKGLKVGVPPGAAPSGAAEWLGQKYVYIASTDMLMAFQQGVVDAYSTGATQLDALKVWEWAKYLYIFPGRAPATTIIMMNPKTFDALPASFQQVLTGTIVPAIADYTNKQAQSMDASLITSWTKNGVTVNKMTPAEQADLWAATKDNASNQKVIGYAGPDLWNAIDSLRPSKG